jgi:hypothetical protein
MPPRRGLRLFDFDFNKEVAPTVLVAGFGEANSCLKFLDTVWK